MGEDRVRDAKALLEGIELFYGGGGRREMPVVAVGKGFSCCLGLVYAPQKRGRGQN
jgi:hypothetical protein